MKFYKSLKKSGLIYLLVLPVMFSCAQSKSSVKNVKAFYTVWMPGNIMVGPDGEPLPGSGPRINYTFYAETASQNITWDTAFVYDIAYKISPSLISEKVADVGKNKTTQQPIIIKASNGGYLWQLTLNLNDKPAPPIADEPQRIVLTGTENGKKFSYLIENAIELFAPESY